MTSQEVGQKKVRSISSGAALYGALQIAKKLGKAKISL
jgi:hypothetical protein